MALAVQVLRLAEGNKISMTAQMRAICNNHFLFEISQTNHILPLCPIWEYPSHHTIFSKRLLIVCLSVWVIQDLTANSLPADAPSHIFHEH